MSQQKTYELARINMEDAFSCQPLNDNADVVEDALNTLDAAKTNLTSRVTTLEARKIAFGMYHPTTSHIVIGFRPTAVFAIALNQSGTCGVMYSRDLYPSGPSNYEFFDDGFSVRGGGSTFGVTSATYAYLAVA